MFAICPYPDCGLEAKITITSSKTHSYSFSLLNCRLLLEKASELGGTTIGGRCPHIEKAVLAEAERFLRSHG